MVDPAEFHAAKQALRAALRQRRDVRSEDERADADARRTAAVLDFLGDVSGLTVASYLSVAPEPDTTEIVSALHVGGARVLLPVLTPHADGSRREAPTWAVYTGPAGMRSGLWGIPEPSSPPLGPQALADVDVIITSALAATASGQRLGVGGGWFDRVLAGAPASCVSMTLVSADELLETLPCEPWDLLVDVIATEAGVQRAT